MNPSSSKIPGMIATKPVSFSKIIVDSDSSSKPPSGREGHCACSLEKKLYVFGGVCKSDTDDCIESDELLMFDTSSNLWMKIDASGDVPPPRSAAVMNAVGKKLYLFGGLSQYSGWFKDMYSFDSENANWQKLNPSGNGPSGRDKLASAVIDHKIYFFGGFGPKGSLDSDDDIVDADDDDDDEYEDIDNGDEIGEVRQQQKAADFGWFNDLYIFDTSTCSWSQPMQMNLGVPTMRAAHGLCSLGQHLVVFGGRDTDGRQNDIHVFDTVSRKWAVDIKEHGCPPDRRSFHTLTALDDNLALVFGGRSEANDHFGDCHIFDKRSSTWYKVPVEGGLSARGCHTCTLVNDKIIVYGGSAQFLPEIQHCSLIFSDLHAASAKDLMSAVPCS